MILVQFSLLIIIKSMWQIITFLTIDIFQPRKLAAIIRSEINETLNATKTKARKYKPYIQNDYSVIEIQDIFSVKTDMFGLFKVLCLKNS